MARRFNFAYLFLVLAAASPVLVQPGVVQAQTQEELDAARAKFQRALELEHAENHAGALKLFRQVAQVKMTPQVRYHIALNEEALGQLVAALGGYELALKQAEGMNPNFVSEVESSVEDLRGRIPKLIIERGEGAEAAAVQLDGVALGVNSIGSAVPLDPGPHSVIATAPGYQDFSTTIDVPETETERLVIEMQPLPEDAVPLGTGDGGGSAEGFGIVPFVVGGGGLAVAAAGGVLLGVSQSNVSQVRDLCGGTDCRGLDDPEWSEARDLRDTAVTLETAGWISIGVGAAALATGTVLYFVDPSRSREKQPETAGIRWLPTAPGAQAGFSVQGRF